MTKISFVLFLAHLIQRLTRRAYSISIEPSSVCGDVSFLLSMDISATSGPIATKFYLKHYWGGEKLQYGLDRIRTLIYTATDNYNRVILGKRRHHVFSTVFDWILFILKELQSYLPLNQFFKLIFGKAMLYSFLHYIFHRILFILAGKMNMHKTWMSLNVGQIPLLVTELSSLCI